VQLLANGELGRYVHQFDPDEMKEMVKKNKDIQTIMASVDEDGTQFDDFWVHVSKVEQAKKKNVAQKSDIAEDSIKDKGNREPMGGLQMATTKLKHITYDRAYHGVSVNLGNAVNLHLN